VFEACGASVQRLLSERVAQTGDFAPVQSRCMHEKIMRLACAQADRGVVDFRQF
jgi:hypothetical protein